MNHGKTPLKFARYGSVRHAAKTLPDSCAPEPPGDLPMASKSMSRYRRYRDPASNTTNVLSHPVTPNPDRVAQKNHRQDALDRLTGDSDEPTRLGHTRPRDGHGHQNGKDRGAKEDHPNRSSGETKRRSWMEKMKLPRSRETAKGPEPSHTALGMDAPVSAVNSGERRVRVQYKTSSIILPVTPVTHGQDLLSSAANYFTDVDPATFILVESFSSGPIGLERHLRRYEYVRDVMNSWAFDNENFLFIVPPASAEALNPLDIRGAPAERPEDTTFYLYHSRRPRKWDKRYVTLRTDGQVTVSKKKTKDYTNICHLSDFDIYSPTVRTLSEVKPPKRVCYAIKSQQKSSLFVTTDKFVHFFATEDRRVAEDWHKAVQTWRSWYMVNMLGAGDPQVDANRRNEALYTKTYSNRNSNEHHSSDPESSSQPLYLIDQAKTVSEEVFSRRKGARERGPPPSAFPRKLVIDTDTTGSLSQDDDSPFSPTGLLGRSYSMRQRDMLSREKERRKDEELLSSQGLVGNIAIRRQASVSTSHQSSRSNTVKSSLGPDTAGPKQSNSTAQSHKPLVDLSPVFQEPPQHRNKGRGVAVEHGVPLVEAATGPNLAPGAIAVPPATTWRRPPPPDEAASIAQSRSRYRPTTARNTSNRVSLATPQHRTAPSSPASERSNTSEHLFVPNSLLSRSLSTTSGKRTGRGVATGNRNATKPMLDLTEEKPFAQGSLLAGS